MQRKQPPVYVVDGLRTPFLKALAAPNAFKASDLAVAVARPLLSRQPFPVDALDDIILGCVMPDATEANIGRLLGLRLGAIQVPGWTVQRNCASGLQALDCAWHKIASGSSHLILAGGTEAMSRAPVLWQTALTTWLAGMSKAKTLKEKAKQLAAFRLKTLKPVIGLLKGLTDPVIGLSMGQTAEHLAEKFHISREQMDQYAVMSHQRTMDGLAEGHFECIVPIYDYEGKRYTKDTGLRPDISLEKLASLKPVFEPPFGKVTAGNSSQISDGAALLILASKEAVKKHHLPVLGTISRVAWSALDPIDMGLGPVGALQSVLAQQGMGWSKVDYLEINEAFATQVLACKKALQPEVPEGLLEERLNVYGGAVAVGHPVSASGARLVLELLHTLKARQAHTGLASLCIGGGQGGAICVEQAG